MKTIKWFTDTETTGLLKQLEQILSFSVVLEKGADTIEAYERNVLLKENILPNPNALLVNKINPFTTAWKNSAFHEYEAYLHLKNMFTKYKQEGYRIVMIAYNLEFDEIMYKDLFLRYGDNLDNYISVKHDPLITVKKLIEQGKLITKEVQTTFSKSYMTSKLVEVYSALGYDASTFKAHTALDDTLMLQMVAHGIYYLALDKKLDELEAHPENYLVNQVVQVISEDEKMGLHKKFFRILMNDLDNQRLLVLDEQMTTASSPEASVRFVPYSEILDEQSVDAKDQLRIDTYYTQHQLVITEAANALIAKKETKKAIGAANFAQVEEIANKMMAADNKKKAYADLNEDELELVDIAENYCFGKNGKGWSQQVLGPNFLTQVVEMKLKGDVAIGLDPVGMYRLSNNKEEVLVTEKKTLIQEKLLELFGVEKDNEDYKAIVKKIPSVTKFKNAKHPKSLLEEFENAKAEVFSGSDKFKKDLITDLLQFYKKKAPEVYGEVSLPSFKLDLSSLLKKK